MPDSVARISGSLTAPYTQPQTRRHTRSCHLWPCLLSSPASRETQGRVCPQRPKAAQEQYRQPSSDARQAFGASAFLAERRQDRKTRQGHQETPGIFVLGESRLNLPLSTSLRGQLLHNFSPRAIQAQPPRRSVTGTVCWLPRANSDPSTQHLFWRESLKGSRSIIRGKHSMSCCFCDITCLRGRDLHG